MERQKLILGTRGSELALAQSKLVADELKTANPSLLIEQKIITTTGDASTTLSLHEPTVEGAGVFTRQLEQALLKGEIDLAVHSLKDLPVETPAGLVLAAILPRAPVDDLLISLHTGGIEGLPLGANIGTSSPRRALLLKARRPDLSILPIRGNVPTRLQKVAAGVDYDATLLAAAGLGRLGLDLSKDVIPVDGETLWLERLGWMLPAPGQGAIAVETRQDDPMVDLLHVLHHEATACCVTAERLVLKYLGGGCHLALGVLAVLTEGNIFLRAVFVPNETSVPRSACATAPTPAAAARLVADQLHFL